MENKKTPLIKKSIDFKNLGIYFVIYSFTMLVCIILFGLIFAVFYNGKDDLNLQFITKPTEDRGVMVTFKANQEYDFTLNSEKEIENSNDSGSTNGQENLSNSVYTIDEVKKQGELKNSNNENVKLKKGLQVEKINYHSLAKMTEKEAEKEINDLHNPKVDTKVKLIYPGGGIRTLISTTLFVVLFSILIAVPFGIFSAIYLIEYPISKRLNRIIHFAIDSLAGIPSIIFGLFGTVFFSVTLGLGASLLAGILTVSIMLLPIVIKTVEEALLNVPDTYREASYGLGANKTQTIFKVILPAATPGILVATILSIGRVIGETAIFVFVVGTSVGGPTFLGKGSTLTVYAYNITRESSNYSAACAIGAVIIIIVLLLNIMTKAISKKMIK